MGLFGKLLGKKDREEPAEENWAQNVILEDEPVFRPQDFTVTATYGGIFTDTLEDGVEFDLNHGFFRQTNYPDVLYSTANLDGYQIIARCGEELLALEEIQDPDAIEILFAVLLTPEQRSRNKITASFIDHMITDDTDSREAVKKAQEFARFLDSLGVENRN